MSVTGSEKAMAMSPKLSTKNQRKSTTRHSILSDPRLSQLFALSTQLEALADSIGQDTTSSSASSLPSLSPKLPHHSSINPPPPIPPKQHLGINGNMPELNCNDIHAPPRPPKPVHVRSLGYNHSLSDISDIRYERLSSTDDLEDQQEEFRSILDNECNVDAGEFIPLVINGPGPPRYSQMSDYQMSTSSQAGSTPSAHSVLSSEFLLSSPGPPPPPPPPLSEVSSDKTASEWLDCLDLTVSNEDDDSTASTCKTKSSVVPKDHWQTRCVELEHALQKFRDQAQSIRELLRDKVRLFSHTTFLKLTPKTNKDGLFLLVTCCHLIKAIV